MNLTRSKERSLGEDSIEYKDLALYIRKIINVHSAFSVDRDYWLTEREKDFLVATVIHYGKGIFNPISQGAWQIYKKYFDSEVTKRRINTLITTCESKDWLTYDKEGKHVEPIAIFKGIDNEKHSFDFKLRISYEADRQNTD